MKPSASSLAIYAQDGGQVPSSREYNLFYLGYLNPSSGFFSQVAEPLLGTNQPGIRRSNMKLFLCVMALSFVGLGLQAGVMPEEPSNSVLETIIGFNDQKIDYSSDIIEPTMSFKEKLEDLLHFTFMTLFMFI